MGGNRGRKYHMRMQNGTNLRVRVIFTNPLTMLSLSNVTLHFSGAYIVSQPASSSYFIGTMHPRERTSVEVIFLLFFFQIVSFPLLSFHSLLSSVSSYYSLDLASSYPLAVTLCWQSCLSLRESFFLGISCSRYRLQSGDECDKPPEMNKIHFRQKHRYCSRS